MQIRESFCIDGIWEKEFGVCREEIFTNRKVMDRSGLWIESWAFQQRPNEEDGPTKKIKWQYLCTLTLIPCFIFLPFKVGGTGEGNSLGSRLYDEVWEK